MKKFIPLFMALFAVGAFTAAVLVYDRPHIKQEARNDCSILCGEPICFVTYVYYEGEIIKSYYDPFSKLSDSLKIARERDGQAAIKAFKEAKQRLDEINDRLN